MPFEQLKAAQAVAWGPAPWERAARQLAGIHDDLVSRLGVRAGEQCLDLATGTGAVATLAARQDAVMTGLDLASKLIETTRRLAAEDGLEITYEVGDCEDVPDPAASVDAVSSAMGVIAAPGHAAVARELARVCKPGGPHRYRRLGRQLRDSCDDDHGEVHPTGTRRGGDRDGPGMP